jgi:hypothetical protein
MDGKTRRIKLAMVLALFLAGSASAQTGNLYGVVIDDQGMPLRGVTVALAVAGAPRVQVTEVRGWFRYLGLPPGNYDVTAKLEGFLDGGWRGVVVTAGRNTTLELILDRPGSSPLDPRRVPDVDSVSQMELEKIPTLCIPWSTVFGFAPGGFYLSPCVRTTDLD